MEILSPAGNMQSLRAAVFAGADAVYFGSENFNARQNAPNFSETEISEALSFCHERGVLCYATLNTLVRDKEFPEIKKTVESFVKAGIDAFIVQDLGLASYIKKNTDVPVHASTQLTVHSLDGALFLYEKGFSRIVLSRELSKDDIEYIVKSLPEKAETEIFVHGALCMCYSGQCYMSSVIGKRSGNRGLCAQPCRLPYQNGYTLSLKDLSLLEYTDFFKKIGVTSLKIEGRMKSPEYVYSVTKEFSDIKNGGKFSPEREEFLASVFSRNGFTKGYFENKIGKDMFGTKSERSENVSFEQKDKKRFFVDISVTKKDENDLEIRFYSSDGLTATALCPYEKAKNTPTEKEQIKTSLSKFGNTFYDMKSFSIDTPDGIFITVSSLNNARRSCLESLSKQRSFRNFYIKDTEFSPIKKPLYSFGKPRLRGVFLRPENVPENFENLDEIFIPVMKFSEEQTEKYKNKLGCFLPRVFHDGEKNKIKKAVENALLSGVDKFLIGNIGHISFLKNIFLKIGKEAEIHGDYGLNVYNSKTYEFFKNEDIKSSVLSFELPLAALKDFSDEKSGIVAYGRLPFMIMRNCVKSQCKKDEFLTDRRGKKMLLTCDEGCRNSLWNADRLYLADKDLSSFAFLELIFTDENKTEAEKIVNNYLLSLPPDFEEFTRGLYY